MMVRISARVFDAAGHREGQIDATLDWMIGYFSSKCKNVHLMTYLEEAEDRTVAVEISDDVANQIVDTFGECNDKLVRSLLVVAYALGGME